MTRPHTAWRLTSLLIVLLLSTAVIVSIISLSQPLPMALSQKHFTLSIMLMFYAITFLSGLLGRLILSQYTVFLGCIFTLIGLTLLSLTASIFWGTTLVIVGTSMLYINLINLCFAVSETGNIRRLLVALLIYLILLLSTFSYPAASAILHHFGQANAYLMIGILAAIILFLYVFIDHFVVNPVIEDRHALTHYNYWQIVGLVALTFLVLYLVHFSLTHIDATIVTRATMGGVVLGYLCMKKHFMWLFIALILFAYWFNSSIHYTILHTYHHFPHTTDWRVYFRGTAYTQLYGITNLCVMGIAVLIAIFFKWLHCLRKVASYHVLLTGIYLAALASFLPWLGTKIDTHSDHILSWHWMLGTMITQGVSNLLVTVAATALCAQWFQGEKRLMMLGSITTLSGFALLCSNGFMQFFMPALPHLHADYFQIYPSFILALALLNVVWAVLLSVVLKTIYRHTKSFDLYVAS